MSSMPRKVLSLGLLAGALCLGLARPERVEAEEPALADRVEEHLAYCRWKEALATAKEWRAQLVEAGDDPGPADAVTDRVKEEQANEKLDYMYLTKFSKRDTGDYLVWDVQFVTRPSIVGACRVNVYVQTSTRILRMTSRFYEDAMRGEHRVAFSWQKIWESAEGVPLVARVELCYESHAVDCIVLGPSSATEWWKRSVAGSLLHHGDDGAMNPEDRTMRIVDTESEAWTLATVTTSYRRSDRRPNVPMLEGTDVLPKDEASLPPLPKPRVGYVRKSTAKDASKAAPAGAKPAGKSAEGSDDVASRVQALQRQAAYGPDRVVIERAKALMTAAQAAERQDLVDQVRGVVALAEASTKELWRDALRIKKLDIRKPTPDTGGYWLAVVVFQATREIKEPFRLNLYTLVGGSMLYGTGVTVDKLIWDSASQEFAHVFAIDEVDVPASERALRWRAEVGWHGICCSVKEAGGAAPDEWWLAMPAKAHRTRSGEPEAPGRLRVGEWGKIQEAEPSDRLTPEARR